MRRVRACVAAAAALAGAEAAVALLRPRGKLPAPATVEATSYFSPEQIRRARRFRRPQLAIALTSTAVEGLLLARLAARRPAAGAPARPVARAALAGAALSAALTAATLPLAALARRRALRAGLATQSWEGWGQDVAKASAIGSAFAGAGSAGAVALMRRAPRTWWLPGAAIATAAGAVVAMGGPVLLDPLFNRFTPLEPGRTRDDVLELAAAAGVRVREVYAVDASRRTTAVNAYVAGLGATKRVVLFDTLLGGFGRDEVRLVVAHELAHVRFRDVPRALAFLACAAPLALLAVSETTNAIGGGGEPGPHTIAPLALALGLAGTPVALAGNRLSRAVERRADRFALELTGAPEAFVSFQRAIALKNLADPDPPRALARLLATHPPVLERIGAALAYERELRLPGAVPGAEGPAAAGSAGRRTPAGS